MGKDAVTVAGDVKGQLVSTDATEETTELKSKSMQKPAQESRGDPSTETSEKSADTSTKSTSSAPMGLPVHRYSRTLSELREPNIVAEPTQKTSIDLKHIKKVKVSLDDSDKVPSDTPKKEESPKTSRKGLRTSFSEPVKESSERKLKYVDEIDTTSPEKKRSSLTFEETEKKLRFGAEEEPEVQETPLLTSKGMRFEYGGCPKTCERFLSVEEYSQVFVDELAEEALTRERDVQEETAIKVVEGITYRAESDQSESTTSIGTYVCVLEWPTIEEFTVEVGISKLEEYLSYWKFEEDWKYCINFLYGESDAACDFYRYEAIFSIPCKQYPIPQATASVYFTFEVSRIRPKHCLVDMSYCFEGQRLIHRPGKFTFQEVRLFNVIDAKIKFYKTLKF